MLKVYYCTKCSQIFYLQCEKDTSCRCCSTPMLRLNIPYNIFSLLDKDKREEIIQEILASI